MTVNQRGFEPISAEMQKNQIHKDGEVVRLPLRGSITSAGYDFYATKDLVIKPQDKVLFWTDVKVKMNLNEVLLIPIRSSMGINNDLMIANTIGVIDSDYYNCAKNEGNIGICIRNLKPSNVITGVAYSHLPIYTSEKVKNEDGTSDYKLADYKDTVEDKKATLVTMDFPIPILKDLSVENTVTIKAGERVAQGIFVKFEESENCNSEEERVGGTGSTSEETK